MMPWNILGDSIGGLINLADQYIVDKDKQIEFKFKALELKQAGQESLLNSATTPWVDATVKLLFAINTLWRPAVAAAMTAFGAYCHYKGIDIGDVGTVVFDGAFPAWGASRHVSKAKQVIADTKKAAVRRPSWQFDDDDQL